MNNLAEILTEEAAKEFPEMSNPSKLSDGDVNRIAEAVVEKAMEDMGVRDIMIGSAMGEGAIPLYGRETRKEPCSCCLIDPEAPNVPENRMCTTKGAIGTLSNREERKWCSEIKIVSDGRCARALSIREAARECKEKHPDDTEAFFRCYIPAFSQAILTKESNPVKEPWQMTLEEYAYVMAEKYGYGKPRIEWIKAGYGETYRSHKTAVERALREGKPVSPEVLADYPDLAERYGPGEIKMSGKMIEVPIKTKAKLTRDDVRVEVWEERDRLHIGIQNKDTGDYLVSWWDDDAREMFEQGFFKRRPSLEESVLEHAEDVGILAK